MLSVNRLVSKQGLIWPELSKNTRRQSTRKIYPVQELWFVVVGACKEPTTMDFWKLLRTWAIYVKSCIKI